MKFKLDHVNLTVNNLKNSIEWYQKIFNMKLVEQGLSEQNAPWAIVARDDSMVCMTEYKHRKPIDQQGSEEFLQIYHFGFRIGDLNWWERTVQKFNLELYYGGINEYPNSKSWYVKDPSGHTIEVSYSKFDSLKFGN